MRASGSKFAYAAAASLLWCGTALAQTPVYRWVDKAGQAHYSDQPAPDAVEITVAPATVQPPPEAASAAAERAADCKRKKDQLEAYKTADSLSETDALGNVRKYTPEEKQKLVELTQKKVDEACAPAAAK